MGGKIETASQSNSVSDCHRAVACTSYDSTKYKSSPLFVNFFVFGGKQSLSGRRKGFSRRDLPSPSPWFYYRIRARV